MKTFKVKVVNTLYGPKCYIGSQRAAQFGDEYAAMEWLSNTLNLEMPDIQYVLSDKSDITMSEVLDHRKTLEAMAAREAARQQANVTSKSEQYPFLVKCANFMMLDNGVRCTPETVEKTLTTMLEPDFENVVTLAAMLQAEKDIMGLTREQMEAVCCGESIQMDALSTPNMTAVLESMFLAML